MAIKIKDATVINALEGGIMIPVGNLEDTGTPWATTADQIKDFVDADKARVAVSGSYNDLVDKPDLSAYALLTNLNTNFYNKSQVNSLIGSMSGVRFIVVEELPTDGEEGVIYLIKEVDGENENNIYNEYIWLVDELRYELIGSTEADLTNYYTKSEVDGMIPTVNNSTITFTQGGVSKGSITLNQSSAATIALDAGGSFEQVQTDWNETDTSSPKYINNKPTIPSLDGYATENWVEEKGYLTEHQPLKTINNESIVGTGNIEITGGGSDRKSWYGNQGQFDAIPESELDQETDYYISGNIPWDDIDHPYIPTKTSDLENDADFMSMNQVLNSISSAAKVIKQRQQYVTQSEYDEMESIGSLRDDTDYFIEGEISIPTKTSDLENDSGFLTEHQTLKTINNESIVGTGNITIEGFSGDYNDLSNKPTIPTNTVAMEVEFSDSTTTTYNVYIQ